MRPAYRRPPPDSRPPPGPPRPAASVRPGQAFHEGAKARLALALPHPLVPGEGGQPVHGGTGVAMVAAGVVLAKGRAGRGTGLADVSEPVRSS
ncbi:hypothetical protein GCM10009642_63780 [Nocardiopsis metallicus]